MKKLLFILIIISFACKKKDEVKPANESLPPIAIFNISGSGTGKEITITFKLMDSTKTNTIKTWQKVVNYDGTTQDFIIELPGLPEPSAIKYYEICSVYSPSGSVSVTSFAEYLGPIVLWADPNYNNKVAAEIPVQSN